MLRGRPSSRAWDLEAEQVTRDSCPLLIIWWRNEHVVAWSVVGCAAGNINRVSPFYVHACLLRRPLSTLRTIRASACCSIMMQRGCMCPIPQSRPINRPLTTPTAWITSTVPSTSLTMGTGLKVVALAAVSLLWSQHWTPDDSTDITAGIQEESVSPTTCDWYWIRSSSISAVAIAGAVAVATRAAPHISRTRDNSHVPSACHHGSYFFRGHM